MTTPLRRSRGGRSGLKAAPAAVIRIVSDPIASDVRHHRSEDGPPPGLPTMAEVVRDLTDSGWPPERIARTLGVTPARVRNQLCASAPTD